MKTNQILQATTNFTRIGMILCLSLVNTFLFAQSTEEENCFKTNLTIESSGTCQYSNIVLSTEKITNAFYNWDINGDGTADFSGTELNTVSYAFASTGKFEATLTVTFEDCKKISTKEIVVTSVARPVFTIDQTCETIQLTNYTNNYDSIIWLISDGTQSTEHQFNHTFRRDGIFEIELRAIKNGCELREIKEVTVSQIAAKPIISATQICAPSTISFAVDSNNLQQVRWYFNNELVSSKEAFVKSFTDAENLEVKVTVSNSQGCFDSTQTATNIIVQEAIEAKFELSENKICGDAKVTVTDLSNYVDDRTWIWSDDVVQNKNKQVSRSFDKAGIYDLTLVVSRNGGCTDTATQKAAVQVFETPNAQFTLNRSEGCLPLNLELEMPKNNKNQDFYLLLNRTDTITYENESFNLNQVGYHELTLIALNKEAGCSHEQSVMVRVFDTLSNMYAPQIVNLTVVDDEAVQLEWKEMENIEEYRIYRSEANNLKLVGYSTDNYFTEYLGGIDTASFSYVVEAHDKCGFQSALSAIANNMHLKGTYAEDSFPTLRWTEFFGWVDGVEVYEVQKVVDGYWETVEETKVPYFIDRNFDNNNALEATYRIIAHSQVGELKSATNSWTFEFEPNIFIPNAFSPNYDNLNDEYIISAFGFEKVDIKIFNSWGQQIFDSNGINQAWDGTYNGQVVETGTYLCVVNVESPNGRVYNFQNTVAVIK